MKTMTCAEMGGPCETKITAATAEEMAKLGMDHMTAAHPEMAKDIMAMPKEETEKWMTEFNAKWAAKAEDAAPAA